MAPVREVVGCDGQLLGPDATGSRSVVWADMSSSLVRDSNQTCILHATEVTNDWMLQFCLYERPNGMMESH